MATKFVPKNQNELSHGEWTKKFGQAHMLRKVTPKQIDDTHVTKWAKGGKYGIDRFAGSKVKNVAIGGHRKSEWRCYTDRGATAFEDNLSSDRRTIYYEVRRKSEKINALLVDAKLEECFGDALLEQHMDWNPVWRQRDDGSVVGSLAFDKRDLSHIDADGNEVSNIVKMIDIGPDPDNHGERLYTKEAGTLADLESGCFEFTAKGSFSSFNGARKAGWNAKLQEMMTANGGPKLWMFRIVMYPMTAIDSDDDDSSSDDGSTTVTKKRARDEDEVKEDSDTGSVAEEDTGSVAEEDTGSVVEEDAGSVAEEDTGSVAEEDTGSVAEEDTGSVAEEDTGSVAEEEKPPTPPPAKKRRRGGKKA